MMVTEVGSSLTELKVFRLCFSCFGCYFGKRSVFVVLIAFEAGFRTFGKSRRFLLGSSGRGENIAEIELIDCLFDFLLISLSLFDEESSKTSNNLFFLFSSVKIF
jgi:hypothetical protein